MKNETSPNGANSKEYQKFKQWNRCSYPGYAFRKGNSSRRHVFADVLKKAYAITYNILLVYQKLKTTRRRNEPPLTAFHFYHGIGHFCYGIFSSLRITNCSRISSDIFNVFRDRHMWIGAILETATDFLVI